MGAIKLFLLRIRILVIGIPVWRKVTVTVDGIQKRAELFRVTVAGIGLRRGGELGDIRRLLEVFGFSVCQVDVYPDGTFIVSVVAIRDAAGRTLKISLMDHYGWKRLYVDADSPPNRFWDPDGVLVLARICK